MTKRQGIRRKQLLDDPKGMRGHWKLKEEAPDRNLWETRFGKSMDCRKTRYGIKRVNPLRGKWIELNEYMKPL